MGTQGPGAVDANTLQNRNVFFRHKYTIVTMTILQLHLHNTVLIGCMNDHLVVIENSNSKFTSSLVIVKVKW